MCRFLQCDVQYPQERLVRLEVWNLKLNTLDIDRHVRQLRNTSHGRRPSRSLAAAMLNGARWVELTIHEDERSVLPYIFCADELAGRLGNAALTFFLC